jgi:hypothetical protein
VAQSPTITTTFKRSGRPLIPASSIAITKGEAAMLEVPSSLVSVKGTKRVIKQTEVK